VLVQGWNAHYHPRDGASMDSESMEPYTWRKGPRVNDEYTFDDGGDPTVRKSCMLVLPPVSHRPIQAKVTAGIFIQKFSNF